MSQIKNLPEELKPIAGECIGLRQANSVLMSRLESVGVNIEVANAHLEFIMEALVLEGVLTLEQKWRMDLEWEKNLNGQLKKAEEKVINMMEAQRRKAAQTLAVPAEKRLIVPGQD